MGGGPIKKNGRYGSYDRYGRYGGYDALKIDLTHALISSLPALNRGLYQAVTSHVVYSHVVRRLY